ncbi:MAG: hypothetical protein H6514_16335 [Acidimicrobiaceae bacterium]|nr:hypothetical protein [Acidimicrobiaceae bacterium]
MALRRRRPSPDPAASTHRRRPRHGHRGGRAPRRRGGGHAGRRTRGVGYRRRHPGGRLVHGDDGRRGRDDRPQDPARRRVRRGASGAAGTARRGARPAARDPGRSSAGPGRAGPDRLLPRRARLAARAAPHLRARVPVARTAPPGLAAHHDRARRLPARQRDRRRRRTACRTRLGARASRRSDGGPRLAVREGVALRQPQAGGRGRGLPGAVRRVRGRRGIGCRPRRGTVVGGARHAEVGDHVHHPVQCAHDRLLTQPRARRDRPAGLRERTRPVPGTGGTLVIPHDMPSGKELVESVREWLERDVLTGTTGRLQFHTRVAINVLAMVERELELGEAQALAHRARLDELGCADEAELARRIRDGELDDDAERVRELVWASVRDKLSVANPKYLEP